MHGANTGDRTIGRRASRAWMVAAGAALLAGAAWLREPAVPYLAAVIIATVAAVAAALMVPGRGTPGRLSAWLFAFVLVVFVGIAASTQRALERVQNDWPRYERQLDSAGLRALDDALDAAATAVTNDARAALDAPADTAGRFAHLRGLSREAPERAVVLYERGAPVAWAGNVRTPTDTLHAPLGASFGTFYVSLYAVAERGDRRAVATALVHASAPADRLSAPLDSRVVGQTELRAFRFDPPDLADAGGISVDAPSVNGARGKSVMRVHAVPLAPGEVSLRIEQSGRARGLAVLAIALICFVAAAWRPRSWLGGRLGALMIVLAALAMVPLNKVSNVSGLFDPSFYFAPLGGPYTANVGALGITSAVVLLAVLTLLRSSVRLRSRRIALLVVVGVAVASPFLLRDLARGITPPPWGGSTALWLAWQVTICLAASAMLLVGASAGRVALGERRGISPVIAPALAAMATLLAPLLWSAPGRWPEWYPALWIAAVGALALTRRSRALVAVVAIVAGCGAATLVWGATSRKRVELAQRDVIGLRSIDQDASHLLERYAEQLAAGVAPNSAAELLRSYAASDLAAAGYQATLASWPSDTSAPVWVPLSPFRERPRTLVALADSARRVQAAIIHAAPIGPGQHLMLAVPHPDGRATTVAIAPRTRLVPDDPFGALHGVPPDPSGPPPYAITLQEMARRAAPPSPADLLPRWTRQPDAVHGDWIIPTASGWARVHVEVQLRSFGALLQRGALVVLLDLVVVFVLWTVSALGDGGLLRWARARAGRWARSYRAQLTIALFTFFVLPALAFAVWSYQRLRGDDRQSRELVMRETLRAAVAADSGEALQTLGTRLESPLLLYRDGELTASSDLLYESLAPVGLFLAPEVQQRVGAGVEETDSRTIAVGSTRTLFGYRAALGAAGQRLVYAAPARSDEIALDQRRNDLGILVLFATAVGALAALWLSGVAARELARPVGALRSAALAIAAGEREPHLEGSPPAEFLPVFNAFRRMANDLSESRTALEEAQRRTAAVLRNVASGVIAVDASGNVAIANPRAEALLDQSLDAGTPLAIRAPAPLVERARQFATGFEPEEDFELEMHGHQLRGRLTRLASGGVVVTLDDVTELARAQRVLAWGEMARQVAHEIKNPLTPIRLGVQHLRRAYLDGRGNFDRVLEENVGRILREIDRLDEIARAFSRYGTAPAERPAGEPTDIRAVLRDVVALERLGEGDVRWMLDDDAVPALAIAREVELREVLLNILENARLANATEVRCRVERNDGYVRIAVADNGHGIPPEVLPHIFEPHFSTRTSGSGLGLAISRRLVDGWGGSIGVESVRGQGTRVHIDLIVLSSW